MLSPKDPLTQLLIQRALAAQTPTKPINPLYRTSPTPIDNRDPGRGSAPVLGQ